MLTVKDLHKSYQVGKTTYEVLKGVSLTVEKGEFVAVMGPSGSGKTTLLNCISCYIPIDSGEIMLGDRQLANLSEDALAKVRNRQLGFVFQDFLLLDGPGEHSPARHHRRRRHRPDGGPGGPAVRCIRYLRHPGQIPGGDLRR